MIRQLGKSLSLSSLLLAHRRSRVPEFGSLNPSLQSFEDLKDGGLQTHCLGEAKAF